MLSIAILTVSDTRNSATDLSGSTLKECAVKAGHAVAATAIVPDHIYQIRARVSEWIAADGIQVIIATGGTGVTGRDVTPEAVRPLLDYVLEGFGELFRALSFHEIGTAAMQSRAFAGAANGTFIFCLPGSVKACVLAWEKILEGQLDPASSACNLVRLFPRLSEK